MSVILPLSVAVLGVIVFALVWRVERLEAQVEALEDAARNRPTKEATL